MAVISVFGSAWSLADEDDYKASMEVGRLLGAAGHTIMTGGYGGVMEAASRGGAEAGAHVIGVTTKQFERDGRNRRNEWVAEEIGYDYLRDRLRHLVLHADAYVIMPGGVGTLNELASAWELVRAGETPPRPVVIYGDFWRRAMHEFIHSKYIAPENTNATFFVDTPQDVYDVIQRELMKA